MDTLKNYYDRSLERLTNPELFVEEEKKNEPEVAADPSATKTLGTKTEPATGGNDESTPKQKKECNICMDADSDTVFMPCRHMCACATCADKLATCPICRKHIDHCIKVYV